MQVSKYESDGMWNVSSLLLIFEGKIVSMQLICMIKNRF